MTIAKLTFLPDLYLSHSLSRLNLGSLSLSGFHRDYNSVLSSLRNFGQMKRFTEDYSIKSDLRKVLTFMPLSPSFVSMTTRSIWFLPLGLTLI